MVIVQLTDDAPDRHYEGTRRRVRGGGRAEATCHTRLHARSARDSSSFINSVNAIKAAERQNAFEDRYNLIEEQYKATVDVQRGPDRPLASVRWT